MGTRLGRRGFLGLGAGAAGAAAGFGAARGTASAPSPAPVAAAGDEEVAFHGPHQAGITAPAQSRARVAAFDLTRGATRADAARLMRTWSGIAASCCAGRPLPDDDATAYGRGPFALTVTFGIGESLLRAVGLESQIPDALAPLPAFLGDRLDPARSGGDLGVVVAGNDDLVVLHALRALRRAAAGTASVRWVMSGFSDAPASPPATPRNLMGQLDGTDNPAPAGPGFAAKVHVAADGRPAWLRGGSYLVVRRIRMLLDDWDTLGRAAQERVIGRSKTTGAPLTGGGEHTPPDYAAQNAAGGLVIPSDAHIRLANPDANQGAAVLRRGFSYDDGLRPDGAPDAGLLFLAYQADPRTGFTPIQQKLAAADALSRFIRHESSALFAVPPGCRPDGYVGQALLEA